MPEYSIHFYNDSDTRKLLDKINNNYVDDSVNYESNNCESNNCESNNCNNSNDNDNDEFINCNESLENYKTGLNSNKILIMLNHGYILSCISQITIKIILLLLKAIIM